MTKKGRLEVRMSETELENLRRIQQCGDFGDISSTVRFCVSFTKTMLTVLPAALVENYRQTEAAGEAERDGDGEGEKP